MLVSPLAFFFAAAAAARHATPDAIVAAATANSPPVLQSWAAGGSPRSEFETRVSLIHFLFGEGKGLEGALLRPRENLLEGPVALRPFKSLKVQLAILSVDFGPQDKGSLMYCQGAQKDTEGRPGGPGEIQELRGTPP